jgi:hypothetical protein
MAIDGSKRVTTAGIAAHRFPGDISPETSNAAMMESGTSTIPTAL